MGTLSFTFTQHSGSPERVLLVEALCTRKTNAFKCVSATVILNATYMRTGSWKVASWETRASTNGPNCRARHTAAFQRASQPGIQGHSPLSFKMVHA